MEFANDLPTLIDLPESFLRFWMHHEPELRVKSFQSVGRVQFGRHDLAAVKFELRAEADEP